MDSPCGSFEKGKDCPIRERAWLAQVKLERVFPPEYRFLQKLFGDVKIVLSGKTDSGSAGVQPDRDSQMTGRMFFRQSSVELTGLSFS